MFKNLIIYRITAPAVLHHNEIAEALAAVPFVACGPTQQASIGWVPPRGVEHGALLEAVGNHWIASTKQETKAVPAQVLKRRVDEMAKKVEDETGRKPGKKLRKELKEKALLELLPAAFPKQVTTSVWVDPAARLDRRRFRSRPSLGSGPSHRGWPAAGQHQPSAAPPANWLQPGCQAAGSPGRAACCQRYGHQRRAPGAQGARPMSAPGIGQRIRVEISGHKYYVVHSGVAIAYGQTVEHFDGQPMQVPSVTMESGGGVRVVALKQPLRTVLVYKE